MGITENHELSKDGKPFGGQTSGRGFEITWQRGPLLIDGQRVEPNGAFVQDVISAAIGRLQFYQSSDFRCSENAMAITKLEEAMHWMDHRTQARMARDVEGTWEV